MPIPVQDVVTRVAAQLDAEGSQFYLFDQDYRPAIWQAQDFVVGVINSELGKVKFSEEIFRDLTYAQVWQMSQYSRVIVDPPSPAGGQNEIWSIIDVIPLPTTAPAFTSIALPNPNNSAFRGDLSHLESEFWATRLSAEEWEKNKRNPFAQGHTPEAGETPSSYGYLMQTNYSSINYQPLSGQQPIEIEIRPSIAGQPVTIKYVKRPSQPTLITDFIEFPLFVTEIITAATANFMSYKQADQTNLEGLSSKLLAMLFTENS